MKLKNYIYLTVLSLSILFITVSCEKENPVDSINIIESSNKTNYKITSLNELTYLKPIVENIRNVKPTGLSYAKTASNSKNVSEIDIEEIIQYTNETGFSTYTFKLENNSEKLIFENLHLIEVENGYIAYILSYEPDPVWYSNNLSSKNDFPFNLTTFQGYLTKYSLERDIIWSTKKDVSFKTSKNNSSAKTSSAGYFIQVCITTEPEPCLEGRHNDSTGWDDCAYSDGHWNETCQSVWVSGELYPQDNPDYEGDGTGGGRGNNSDDDNCINVTGTNISDSQPISGIDGQCAPNTVISPYYMKLNEVFTDPAFEDIPCLYNIYEAMGKTVKFDEYLKKFESDASVANLRFSADDSFSTNPEFIKYHNAMAITSPPIDTNDIKITFNTDPNTTGNILDKPDVFKVVSMIHELLHAEMYRKMLDAVIAANINQTSLNWTDWSSADFYNNFLNSLENKYEGIFYYFTKYKYGVPTNQEPNDYQHQQLAQYYRGVIKQALTDYDPTLTANEKEALSWIGLDSADIVAWQNLTPSERTTINQLQSQIQNSFPNGCK
jgi:hypothetical protein